MNRNVLITDVAIVDGGVEHTVRLILQDCLNRANTRMGTLLTPSPHNQQFISDCRAMANPMLEAGGLAPIFFGPQPNHSKAETALFDAVIKPQIPLKRQTTLKERIKKIVPADFDNFIWHHKLIHRSANLFRHYFEIARPDIIHGRAGMYNWFAPAVVAIERMKPKPKIMFHLGCEPVLGKLPGFVIRKWAKIDFMVYVSSPIRQAWHDAYPLLKRIPSAIIHHGLNLQDFPTADRSRRIFSREHPFIIGICSRLSGAKGIPDAIHAFARVHAEHPFTRLEIVGDGVDYQKLVRLAREKDLGESVVFHGHQHNVFDYMARFDLFIQPSRNEALGLSIIEAMSTALPVIATNAGGIPEVVDDGVTGRLIEIGDTEALYQGMVEMIKNPAVRQQFGRAGRIRVEKHFSLARMCNEIHSLYDQLLTNPAHSSV